MKVETVESGVAYIVIDADNIVYCVCYTKEVAKEKIQTMKKNSIFQKFFIKEIPFYV